MKRLYQSHQGNGVLSMYRVDVQKSQSASNFLLKPWSVRFRGSHVSGKLPGGNNDTGSAPHWEAPIRSMTRT
jgi:hypothetical protein